MKTKKTPRLSVRWMIRNDLPQVLDMERTGCQEPWDEDQYIHCLRQRNSIGMIAETANDVVVGVMAYELHKYRLEILRFLVRCGRCRRVGVGRLLMNKLKLKLSPGRRSCIKCNVPEAALDMQLFLRSQGFTCEEILRDSEEYRFVYRGFDE